MLQVLGVGGGGLVPERQGGVSDINTNTLCVPGEGGPMPPHHSPPLDPAAHFALRARAQS